MGAPGGFRWLGGSRLGHRAAREPVRERFDGLGQRLHLGLKPAHAPLDRGHRSAI